MSTSERIGNDIDARTPGRAARERSSGRAPASARRENCRGPRCHASPSAQRTRAAFSSRESGRAGLALLLVAALALVGAVVWFTRAPAVSPGISGTSRPAPAVTPPTTTELATPGEPAPAARTSDAPAVPPPVATAGAELDLRLRLELRDERGQPLAGDFDVEVRAVLKSQDGAARAAPVRTQLRGPRTDLRIDTQEEALRLALSDPPQAAVIVRRTGAHAEGVVPLVRSTEERWTQFTLRSTSVIRGTVVDGANNPLEGVAVMLRDNTPGKEPHSVVRTDAGGSFAIDAFPWTKNRLFVGDDRYPWSPIQEIDATTGDRVLDPIRLELYAATFLVQKPDGTYATDAQLEGVGLDGGRFTARTDADGRARVTTLLRGRWRVNAALASHGRGSRAIEVPLENDEPVLILLPR